MIILKRDKKKRGTRHGRKTAKKTGDHRLDVFLFYLRRFGLALGVIVFVVWAGAWAWLSGSVSAMQEWGRTQAIETLADNGFRVENILVEGRVNTDPDVLLGLMNMQKGDPLFAFNPKEAQELIEKISWVKSVRVERRWPDTIYIGLTERVPLALWHDGERFLLVDQAGKALTDYNLNRFDTLMRLSGEGANHHALDLLSMLEAEETLEGRLVAAEYMSERRWNLRTDNKIVIKLPETDVGLALRRLVLAQKDKAVLNMDLQYIDLRDPGRIIIKGAGSAAQEFKASVTGGDAI